MPDYSAHQSKSGDGKMSSNFTGELSIMMKASEMYLSLLDTKNITGLMMFCNSQAALEVVLGG